MKKHIGLIFLFSLPIMAKDLVVHEWGTFTSLVGSDGSVQEGMHHEEEPLPNFVYGFHNPQNDRSYFDDRYRCGKMPCQVLDDLKLVELPEIMPTNPLEKGITQKMETPVIYFYGDKGTEVDVKVEFPQGIISQYYPRAESYSPKYDDISSIGPSNFDFSVKLEAENDYLGMPATYEKSIWNPAREVNANTISVNSESEKFIFYRGVGNFSTKIKVTANDSSVTVNNLDAKPISHAFILRFTGSYGDIKALGEVKSTTNARIPGSSGLGKHGYVTKAKNMIASALVERGLFKDEARAMVNTWEKSYFLTPGVRVLYFLNDEETEAIIPLTLDPKPKELVRVLVGRVDVMLPSEEQGMLKDLVESKLKKEDLGRLYEPKLRRILQIAQSNTSIDSNEVKIKIDELLK